VRAALHLLDPRWLAIAAGLTVINLVLFGLYDLVALARTSVPPAARWRLGTLAFAWSNFLTLGLWRGRDPHLALCAVQPRSRGAARRRHRHDDLLRDGARAVLVCVAVFPPLAAFAAAAVLLAIVAYLLGSLEKAEVVPGWLKRGGGGWRALLAVALADWILAALVFAAALQACRADLPFRDALRASSTGRRSGSCR
jgi:hypothetical protein